MSAKPCRPIRLAAYGIVATAIVGSYAVTLSASSAKQASSGASPSRSVGPVYTGERTAPGPYETRQWYGYLLEFCAGTLKLQLSANMNINVKKGTIVTLTVPPQVVMNGPNTSWNSVTVEFFPATGIVKSMWFTGPGPKDWERNPCQEPLATSPNEQRPPNIRK